MNNTDNTEKCGDVQLQTKGKVIVFDLFYFLIEDYPEEDYPEDLLS